MIFVDCTVFLTKNKKFIKNIDFFLFLMYNDTRIKKARFKLPEKHP